MESAKNLLQYTDDQRIQVLKAYNRTPESIKIDIGILRTWLLSQPHLPKIHFSDKRLENFLLLNKLSIEKTKQKIDMYFTMRRLAPEFYVNKQPYAPAMKSNGVYKLPLRTLTKDLYRVVLYRNNSESSDPVKAFAHCLNVAEIELDYDCHLGIVIIIDVQHITMQYLTKVTPLYLKKIIQLSKKIFSNLVKGIHIVNASSSLDTFVSLFKSLLQPKMADRVVVHKNVDMLKDYLPKEILPKEYGGEEISIHDLHDEWYRVLEEYTPWFKKLSAVEVNESLRPGKPVDDEILGFHGNFRKLDID